MKFAVLIGILSGKRHIITRIKADNYDCYDRVKFMDSWKIWKRYISKMKWYHTPGIWTFLSVKFIFVAVKEKLSTKKQASFS